MSAHEVITLHSSARIFARLLAECADAMRECDYWVAGARFGSANARAGLFLPQSVEAQRAAELMRAIAHARGVAELWFESERVEATKRAREKAARRAMKRISRARRAA